MATSLRPGMDVCGCDGLKIGTVHRLFSAAARTARNPDEIDLYPSEAEHMAVGDLPTTYEQNLVGTTDYSQGQMSGGAPLRTPDRPPGPAELPEGAMTFSPSDTKYMEVRHHGLLRLRHETIYVPLSAVEALSEDSITLACTRDGATQLYGDRPAPDEPV